MDTIGNIEIVSLAPLSNAQLAELRKQVVRRWQYYDACDDIYSYHREVDEREMCWMYLTDINNEMSRRTIV